MDRQGARASPGAMPRRPSLGAKGPAGPTHDAPASGWSHSFYVAGYSIGLVEDWLYTYLRAFNKPYGDRPSLFGYKATYDERHPDRIRVVLSHPEREPSYLKQFVGGIHKNFPLPHEMDCRRVESSCILYERHPDSRRKVTVANEIKAGAAYSHGQMKASPPLFQYVGRSLMKSKRKDQVNGASAATEHIFVLKQCPRNYADKFVELISIGGTDAQSRYGAIQQAFFVSLSAESTLVLQVVVKNARLYLASTGFEYQDGSVNTSKWTFTRFSVVEARPAPRRDSCSSNSQERMESEELQRRHSLAATRYPSKPPRRAETNFSEDELRRERLSDKSYPPKFRGMDTDISQLPLRDAEDRRRSSVTAPYGYGHAPASRFIESSPSGKKPVQRSASLSAPKYTDYARTGYRYGSDAPATSRRLSTSSAVRSRENAVFA